MTTDLLNLEEDSARIQLESRIQAGLGSFIDVGEALSEIRDRKLYRSTHGTFEEYCREKWKMTDRRARYLMGAAKTGTMVPVSNERQARELAKVEPAKRAEVMERVRVRTGGKVTAAAIRAEVEPLGAVQAGRPAGAAVTTDAKRLAEWVKAHDAGMPVAEIARSYRVTEADVRGALQLPARPDSKMQLSADRYPDNGPGSAIGTFAFPFDATPEPKESPPWSIVAAIATVRDSIEGQLTRAPEAMVAELKVRIANMITTVCSVTVLDKPAEAFGDRCVIPPLPEWVTAYSLSIEYPMNGQKWCDGYATKGWYVGKVKMKDWQAACRNWRDNRWGVGSITIGPAASVLSQPKPRRVMA